MPASKASESIIDFTDVADAGDIFNKKRQKEGDYKAKVTGVKDAPTKEKGEPQWLFTIQVGSGVYPYYCKLQANQLWKVRNLLQAAGLNVPKKRVKVDPNKLVGKTIAVTLTDEEYNGKPQSEISHTFAVADLDDSSVPDEADDADEVEEEDEAPAPKAKAKPKPAPVVEDDEDEDEEEPPPPPKKKKAAPVVEDDDDLEEIDIDDT